MTRRALPLVLLALLSAPEARAYPQLVGKSYTACATCHYDPQGGGLANSYGRAVSEATFPDDLPVGAIEAARELLGKPDVTGYDEAEAPALQLDGGVDVRLLLLPAITETDGEAALTPVPMLLEGSVAAAYGPWLALGSLTPRRSGASERPDLVASRAHWVGRRLGEGMLLRAGRLTPPFGLRVADHTTATREGLGLGKWGQTNAIELDVDGEVWSFAVAALIGDLFTDLDAQRRGLSGTVAFQLPGRAALGLSALADRSTGYTRVAAGPNVRLRLVQRLYALLDGALEHRSANEGDAGQTALLSHLRLGWFPRESLDLFATLDGRALPGAYEATRLRWLAGAEWRALPWLELGPSIALEEDVEGGPRTTALLQLHLSL